MNEEKKKTSEQAAGAEQSSGGEQVSDREKVSGGKQSTGGEETSRPEGAVRSTFSSVSTRSWTMACHLISLVMFLGIPFGNIFGPMVIWLIKRDAIPAVDIHGKESMNFQISMTIYYIIAGILCTILIGFVFLAILFVLHIVFVIQAAVAADRGDVYRYPLTIRFIS